MSEHQTSKRGTAAVCLLIFIAVQSVAMSCGLRWTEPRSHFDGVDYQGHVHLIEKLGSLEAGKTKLPIFLIFNSGNNQISPYVGSGFSIPLLESRMVAVDPHIFKFEQPDGWFQLFWRDKKNPSILHGSAGGWTAEIKGDIITAWADCGAKVTFSKGRITQLQLKDQKFEYIYSGDKVSEIREDGATVLKVTQNVNTGEVTGLSLGMNGDVTWELGQKPRIQRIGEQNVISGMDRALIQVNPLEGKSETFEFGVDEQIRPTVKMSGTRKFVWDPALKHILKDGEWVYEIKSDEEDQFANAAIGRTNEDGDKETWFLNVAEGVEEIQKRDGTKQKIARFASGSIAGNIRKIEENGKVVFLASFDERGRLLRRTISSNLFTYTYGDGYTSIQKNGLPHKWQFYKDGKLDRVVLADGTEKQYAYDKSNKQTATVRLPSGTVYYEKH